MPNSPEKGPDQLELEETKFEQAQTDAAESLVGEFVAFLGENKKWWMAPILIVFGLLMLLAILGSTPVAPFIYSLF